GRLAGFGCGLCSVVAVAPVRGAARDPCGAGLAAFGRHPARSRVRTRVRAVEALRRPPRGTIRMASHRTEGGARMRLSVVIATYNRPQLLQRLLAQLEQQTFRNFEVIVVDDGSNPEAAVEGAKARGLRRANAGPAAGRQAGGFAASGGLVACSADDMQVARVSF